MPTTRRAATQGLALERQLSDLVNAAYGLTPEEVALMWATAAVLSNFVTLNAKRGTEEKRGPRALASP